MTSQSTEVAVAGGEIRQVPHVGLAWWNTGLSPPGKRGRGNDTELAAVAAMLVGFGNSDVQFIVLGEIASADIDRLQKLCESSLDQFRFYDSTSKAGRGQFDTCIVYRPDVVSILDRLDVVQRVENSTSRVGQYFKINIDHDQCPLHIIASHWPSRLMVAENSPQRYGLALRLRNKVDDILADDDEAHIILLGDYNDEPFDLNISDSLRSTRDRSLVLKRRSLLYNPFWRHLSSYEHVNESYKYADQGTYFHQAGEVTRWRTFDQMMFSSAFIRGVAGWYLDEHSTRVLDVPAFTELVVRRTYVFDHLPIVSRISRRITHA
jgi:hypothetical protein